MIVGVFNLGKMIGADVYQRSGMAFFMVPFFTFHYGLFSLVHGVFVFVILVTSFKAATRSQDCKMN